MVEILVSSKIPFQKKNVYSLIDNIHKLSLIKKGLKNYRVARDEPELQIIDKTFSFFLFKIPARLKYTPYPEKSCELKQIKGRFKEYLCLYNFTSLEGHTVIKIHLRIKFPLGPVGFIISKILSPFYQMKLEKELSVIEKILTESEK